MFASQVANIQATHYFFAVYGGYSPQEEESGIRDSGSHHSPVRRLAAMLSSFLPRRQSSPLHELSRPRHVKSRLQRRLRNAEGGEHLSSS